MKTEVYSWRLSADLKADLEAEARRQKKSVSALLAEFSRQGLRRGRKRKEADEAEQARLHAEVAKYIGSVEIGLGPYTNARIRESFRREWEEKRARNRPR